MKLKRNYWTNTLADLHKLLIPNLLVCTWYNLSFHSMMKILTILCLGSLASAIPLPAHSKFTLIFPSQIGINRLPSRLRFLFLTLIIKLTVCYGRAELDLSILSSPMPFNFQCIFLIPCRKGRRTNDYLPKTCRTTE